MWVSKKVASMGKLSGLLKPSLPLLISTYLNLNRLLEQSLLLLVTFLMFFQFQFFMFVFSFQFFILILMFLFYFNSYVFSYFILMFFLILTL